MAPSNSADFIVFIYHPPVVAAMMQRSMGDGKLPT
jgi:hypothetical protein